MTRSYLIGLWIHSFSVSFVAILSASVCISVGLHTNPIWIILHQTALADQTTRQRTIPYLSSESQPLVSYNGNEREFSTICSC
ncbi:hypothetical protein PHET_01402 [Paragonimus heterotremus]|uniref:Uncharacterized protein n=1 Tax=Paragonimus heterotremus TaxID=100268 RepID=A0A8J4T3H3_9TREM|nr:hypothetical protein PHET_01402 [Paragonimus heterotremus]